MRITLAMSQQQTLQDLNNNSTEISRLASAISSGTTLAKPSDDPSAWAQAMNVRQGLREYDAIGENLDFVTSWGNTTDSALNQLHDVIAQAKNAAIKAQGPDCDEARASLVATVDGLLEDALSLANSQHGDRYIFSGLADAKPYSMDASGNAIYAGDTKALVVRTGTGTNNNETINLTGPEVFDYTNSSGGTSNLMEDLYALKQAMSSNDTTTLAYLQDDLDLAAKNISKCQSKAGLLLSRTEDKQNALLTITTNRKDTLSNIQDTDLASAITQLQTKQTALQAALQVTGMLSNLNLTQYL